MSIPVQKKVFYNHESEMYDNTTMRSYGVNISKGDQEMDIWDSSLLSILYVKVSESVI